LGWSVGRGWEWLSVLGGGVLRRGVSRSGRRGGHRLLQRRGTGGRAILGFYVAAEVAADRPARPEMACSRGDRAPP
jgi:hypothetical protein